jgi:leucyl-tRNA synthetase
MPDVALLKQANCEPGTTDGHLCPTGLQGAEITFKVSPGDGATAPADSSLMVYTTRPDTLCGATYMVVAPEHPLLPSLTAAAHKGEVEAYVEAAARKSDLERTELQKDKTGVFTGG